MLATALSRVLGYVREVVVAAYFGTSYQIDAYRVAIQLPNLFRLVMGDVVIAAAFVPIFSSYLAKQKEEEAWRIASKILTLTVLFLSGITILGELLAPYLIKLLAPGFTVKPETFSLSVHLTRIMFPSLVFMALSGIFSGLLNSYEVFLLPAVSPVLWNVIIIASIVLFSEDYGIVAFATGLLVATVFQVIVQVPGFRGKLRKFTVDFDFSHQEVRNFFALLIPIVIGSATSNINTIVDTRFASYLETGVISALGYAVRIYMVPAGVVGVAVATVLFPRLVKLEALNEGASFARNLSFGLRVINSVMMPLAAFFVFFSLPVVRILFERGNFHYSDSLLTASALTMYSIGVVSSSHTLLLTRAFYSKKDSKTPLYVAFATIAVNYFGDWFLMQKMPQIPQIIPALKKVEWLFLPHAGIALSTSLVSIFQFVVLYVLFVWKYGNLESRKFILSLLKSLAGTVVAVLSGSAVYNLISLPGTTGLLLALTGALLAGFVSYVISSVVLKTDEASYIVEVLKERLKKS